MVWCSEDSALEFAMGVNPTCCECEKKMGERCALGFRIRDLRAIVPEKSRFLGFEWRVIGLVGFGKDFFIDCRFSTQMC